MRDIFEYNNNFSKYSHVKSILQYGDTGICINPCISVIMPVFGNPKYFLHSLNSVINQDASFCYEVVIVDNTPLSDGKSEVLKLVENTNLPNIFYYRNEENIGMSGNWNRGIELARASLITFCHDDDMLYPDCLSMLWNLHFDYPGKLIIPLCRFINENVLFPLNDERPVSHFNGCVEFGKLDIFMGNPTNGVGCLFYKKDMIDIGGYNEEYYPSQDNALHIKYIVQFGAVRCRKQLYCYRITSDNASNTIYKKFISNGVFYSKCMYPYIKLPQFILKSMTHAYTANITEAMERKWGKDGNFISKRNCTDKIINLLFDIRCKLKTWK